MDAADRELLERAVHDGVANAASPARAGVGVGVDAVLAELGWLEMLDAEARDAVDIVFTALGTTNTTATALDDVIVAALGIEPRADLAAVLPPFATWDRPGRVTGGRVHAVGLTTTRIDTAIDVVMVCETDSQLHRVVMPAAAVDVTPVRGIDPDAGLHTVRIDGSAADATPLEGAAWDAAVAAGRRATAHQLLGASRSMLDLARTHALERVQFGRPVARFQAVRHRLAEALVAIEALDATLTAAWDEPGPMTAALAKATAGRTARAVATHCQQVLAGIGFTTDHPFHRFLKRTMALEGLFGSTDRIVADLGHQLLGARAVPTLIEL